MIFVENYDKYQSFKNLEVSYTLYAFYAYDIVGFETLISAITMNAEKLTWHLVVVLFYLNLI